MEAAQPVPLVLRGLPVKRVIRDLPDQRDRPEYRELQDRSVAPDHQGHRVLLVLLARLERLALLV